MRILLEKIVGRLGKHKKFSLDRHLSTVDLVSIVLQNTIWAVRGRIQQVFFQQSIGLVMVGEGVKIRYPRYLKVGKNFIIEDNVEIVALSKRGITCGNNVTIGAFSTIKPSSYYGRNIGEGLEIGDNSNIGRYSYVGCSGFIKIGKNVMVSPRVSFFAENHNFEHTDRPMKEQGVTREPIVIEDDCWIASGSIVLAGVTIGKGSVVAAGSVVTKDIPAYSIVAGSPARIIRNRKESIPNAPT